MLHEFAIARNWHVVDGLVAAAVVAGDMAADGDVGERAFAGDVGGRELQDGVDFDGISLARKSAAP